MMKLVVLAALVAFVAAQADRYPAGLNPAVCPNFPYCDNTVVALYNSPSNYLSPVSSGAAKYPAGVHPAACPNYPYCGTGASVPAGYVRNPDPNLAYPAGVSPAACPNYPYCH